MNFFKRLSSPFIDPETPVEEWRSRVVIANGTIFTNKTFICKSTWGESKSRLLRLLDCLPSNVFGPQEPMYVVEGTYNKIPSKVLPLTKAQFEEACGPYPVRSIEEEIIWMKDVTVVLIHSILKEKIRIAEIDLEIAELQLRTSENSLIVKGLNPPTEG